MMSDSFVRPRSRIFIPEHYFSPQRKWGSLFTIGVFFLLEPSWATIQQTDEPPANPELIPMVVIFTIIIATAFLTRFLVRQKVKRMMMASSDEQRTDSLPEKEADQVLAEHPPAFIELNASSEIADAVQLRESLIDRAQSWFGRAFRYDLAAVAGYILIPMIGGGDALEGVMIALPLLFVSTLRFIAFRDQFRAHQPGLFGCLRPFYTAWFEIAKPQWRIYIAAIAIAAALNNAYDYFGYPWWIEGLRWVMAAAFHMMLIFWLMVSAQNTSNLKLLILRIIFHRCGSLLSEESDKTTESIDPITDGDLFRYHFSDIWGRGNLWAKS